MDMNSFWLYSRAEPYLHYCTSPFQDYTEISFAVNPFEYLSQIEELLCEKLAEHWAQVSEGLTRADPGRTGRVTPRELRKVVERACVPLSNEHFTKYGV